MTPTILVTGATGYVGRWLCRRLSHEHSVLGAVRDPSRSGRLPAGVEAAVIGDLSVGVDWPRDREIGAVVHLAAAVHRPEDGAGDDFARVNVEGSRRLARAAGRAGVKRFVFASSIAVYGAASASRPLSERDAPSPNTAYGRSKLEAEEALLEIGRDEGLEIVVLRPAMVYGPGAPGNFARLSRAVVAGVPLPFRGVRNARSFIHVENLTDALRAALVSGPAAGAVYCVADRDPMSTLDLVGGIAGSHGIAPRLFAVPRSLARWGAAACGRTKEFRQLFEDLVVDTRLVASELGWVAPLPVVEALRRCGPAGDGAEGP